MVPEWLNPTVKVRSGVAVRAQRQDLEVAERPLDGVRRDQLDARDARSRRTTGRGAGRPRPRPRRCGTPRWTARRARCPRRSPAKVRTKTFSGSLSAKRLVGQVAYGRRVRRRSSSVASAVHVAGRVERRQLLGGQQVAGVDLLRASSTTSGRSAPIFSRLRQVGCWSRGRRRRSRRSRRRRSGRSLRRPAGPCCDAVRAWPRCGSSRRGAPRGRRWPSTRACMRRSIASMVSPSALSSWVSAVVTFSMPSSAGSADLAGRLFEVGVAERHQDDQATVRRSDRSPQRVQQLGVGCPPRCVRRSGCVPRLSDGELPGLVAHVRQRVAVADLGPVAPRPAVGVDRWRRRPPDDRRRRRM